MTTYFACALEFNIRIPGKINCSKSRCVEFNFFFLTSYFASTVELGTRIYVQAYCIKFAVFRSLYLFYRTFLHTFEERIPGKSTVLKLLQCWIHSVEFSVSFSTARVSQRHQEFNAGIHRKFAVLFPPVLQARRVWIKFMKSMNTQLWMYLLLIVACFLHLASVHKRVKWSGSGFRGWEW